MKKKKVINKGYTLEVTSWENDADNYRTKFFTVDTREEAAKLYKICNQLFKSCNNGDGGVGNSMDGKEKQVLIDFVENNPSLFTCLDEEYIENYFQNIAYNLMGGSEYYDYRVCESCKVTYSEEDIYLEQILFE